MVGGMSTKLCWTPLELFCGESAAVLTTDGRPADASAAGGSVPTDELLPCCRMHVR